MAQYKGSRSRVLLYPETALGQDPGAPVGYVIPLTAQTQGAQATQARVEAPIFMGNRLPFSSILGMCSAQGTYPIGLDRKFIGVLLKMMTGASVAPAANFAGTGKYLHYFQIIGNDPLSFQLQSEYQESPGVFRRGRGYRAGTMKYGFSASGPVTYGLDVMGIGDEVYTDLAGTKTDYGYAAMSYFNGMLKKGSTILGTVTGFNWGPGNNLTRQDVAFNGGLAYDTIAGNAILQGDLTLIFETAGGLAAFYNDALNDSQVTLECAWTDLPLSLWTEGLFMRIPLVKFSRGPIPVGGIQGLTLQQTMRAEYDPTATGICAAPGFIISNLGPWTVPSPANLGFKVDGGGTVTKALTAGSGRTATQIVADLNASGGIAGATAEVFPDTAAGGVGQHFRVRTNTNGTGGSIQCDTSVANSQHTLVGFSNTVFTGKAPDAWHSWVINSLSAQY